MKNQNIKSLTLVIKNLVFEENVSYTVVFTNQRLPDILFFKEFSEIFTFNKYTAKEIYI